MQKGLEKKAGLLILILGLLTAIGPFSVDLYLPAFPAIAKDLHTSVNTVSLSLSSFFLGLSLGQLLYGPLLERFGRKKPIYMGMVIYIFASLGCFWAQDVEHLIVYRGFQAVGSCAGLVASRAIVRDLFETKEVAKTFSMLMMVVAVSPIVAPSLGAYISAFLGWRIVFATLVLLAVFILLGSLFLLPESKEPDPDYSLMPKVILAKFWEILRHPVFLVNAFTGAIAYAGLYAYISGSPHIYMEVFGLNEQEFGWIFAINAVGLISSNQVNRVILKTYKSERIIFIALVAQLVLAFILLGLNLLEVANTFSTTFLIFGFLFCLGFIFPNASALSLDPFSHTAGNASALMGAVQMVVGALASSLVGLLQGTSSVAMSLVMLICGFLAFCLFFFGSVRRVEKG
ncbi:multidrug effflux MFS transporter [Marinilongibacter aquaticus]|uniref:multidrug effflux MFS transporter n=1 Tax=Marinilongibacter aquaticus TaxID=2975157 RepID=UPI0021BDC16C|nr:multidrug effflux MFS transporter [Marinilongibacter aquaticus]UBM57561.1 multidrug effflux MFS transporter [Marinilongibacter aquaticus]